MDVQRRYIDVNIPPGPVQFELVHVTTTFTPNGGAPPKSPEYVDRFFVHNNTPFNLTNWTVEVIAYNATGGILWTFFQAGINIPFDGTWIAPRYELNPTPPSTYSVSMY